VGPPIEQERVCDGGRIGDRVQPCTVGSATRTTTTELKLPFTCRKKEHVERYDKIEEGKLSNVIGGSV
jgi:hypothetical protein